MMHLAAMHGLVSIDVSERLGLVVVSAEASLLRAHLHPCLVRSSSMGDRSQRQQCWLKLFLVVGKRHLQNDFINLWKIVFSIYVPAVVLLGDSEMNEIELLFSAVFYSLVKKNEDVNKER